MQVKNFILLFIFFIIQLYSVNIYAGICISGTSSLINTPVAKVLDNRNIIVGIGYLNKNVTYLGNKQFNNFPFYVSIGYLPRRECSFGVVMAPGFESYDGTSTYKDAVISLQYLLFKESNWMPSVSIGIRDIYSFILLNTSYLVCSKTIFKQHKTSIQIHTGYGSDIMDEHQGVPLSDKKYPVGHTIIGFFGGFNINMGGWFSYITEYDSDILNTGFKLRLNNYIQLELNLMEMKYPSGGMQINFKL